MALGHLLEHVVHFVLAIDFVLVVGFVLVVADSVVWRRTFPFDVHDTG